MQAVQGLDVDRIRPIVVRCCQRFERLLKQFPDVDLDDLIQMGLMRCLRDLQKFDPGKAKITTWVNRIVQFAIIDFLRKRTRHAGSVVEEVWQRPRRDMAACPDWCEDEDPHELAAWLEGVYDAAREALAAAGVKAPRARREFSLAQRVAVAALVNRLGRRSMAQAQRMLAGDEELRRAVGMDHAPHRTWVLRLAMPSTAQVEAFWRNPAKVRTRRKKRPAGGAG